MTRLNHRNYNRMRYWRKYRINTSGLTWRLHAMIIILTLESMSFYDILENRDTLTAPVPRIRDFRNGLSRHRLETDWKDQTKLNNIPKQTATNDIESNRILIRMQHWKTYTINTCKLTVSGVEGRRWGRWVHDWEWVENPIRYERQFIVIRKSWSNDNTTQLWWTTTKLTDFVDGGLTAARICTEVWNSEKTAIRHDLRTTNFRKIWSNDDTT